MPRKQIPSKVRLGYITHMHAFIIEAYNRLLADVRYTFKVPIGFPDVTHEWVLIEAPKLDKALLRSFEGTGEIPDFPEWLAPLWNAYTKTGDMSLLRLLRTVLCFGYKAEYEPTKQQLEEAEASFVEVEHGIAVWDDSHEPALDPFYRACRVAIHRVLSRARLDSFRSALPHHGPGAVFPSRKPWVKSAFTTQYSSIARYYPWDEWFQGIFIDALMDQPPPVESEQILCAMRAVPKDSRGPRIICVHPVEAIWVQQSQRSVVERAIAQHPLAGKAIKFDDQTVNGMKALESSRTRSFVTLDLKEASDRLSNKLVNYLLGSYADILSCARATHVRLLSGRHVELRKWAPMGNCLTFPIESLVFWAIVHTAIRCHVNIDADIYVFGDDILFPTDMYDVVLPRLVAAGLVPNRDKTFKDGFFRESCGVDAFKGVDITPLRTKGTDGIASYANAESWCSLARRAQIVYGLRELPEWIYGTLDKWLYSRGKFRYLPITNNPSVQGIAKLVQVGKDTLVSMAQELELAHHGHANQKVARVWRWNLDLQKVETRTIRVRTPLRRDRRSWWNVLDSLILLERGGEAGGLAYADPNRSQPQFGWTEVIN